ncbi:MAG: EVE domain-containing protein [Candidatus Riflebacteria bacterium HGW-Riflebacteria-1]|nr:MAG: EVE domain-containing protein [Candidatus Riflebacteria bacterium HGW-Riflebacteria-1]
MAYWLMKCEPSAYSIDDLEKDGSSSWEGVRNYQARNIMRDQMQPGDLALFYHSNAEPSGVAGVMKIVRAGYPDHLAFDASHKYYDARSTPDKPVWYMVDVAFVTKFASILPLQQIKAEPRLKGIMVAQQGSRLSVQPLSEEHFKVICAMAGRKKLP